MFITISASYQRWTQEKKKKGKKKWRLEVSSSVPWEAQVRDTVHRNATLDIRHCQYYCLQRLRFVFFIIRFIITIFSVVSDLSLSLFSLSYPYDYSWGNPSSIGAFFTWASSSPSMVPLPLRKNTGSSKLSRPPPAALMENKTHKRTKKGETDGQKKIQKKKIKEKGGGRGMWWWVWLWWGEVVR